MEVTCISRSLIQILELFFKKLKKVPLHRSFTPSQRIVMTRSRIGLLCLAFLTASLFVLTTCGKNSSTQSTQPTSPTPPPPPPVVSVPTSIIVTPSTTRLNAIGQTVRLAASVLDQNGSAVAGASATWTSGAVDVATVSDQGLVTAVKNGSVVITARSGSLSTTASVTVSQTPGRIVIEPRMAELKSIGRPYS